MAALIDWRVYGKPVQYVTTGWPKDTYVFNQFSSGSTDTKALDPNHFPANRYMGGNVRMRGKPQLITFEGTYDVPYGDPNDPQICVAPKFVFYNAATRKMECRDPSAFTLAELEARAAERADIARQKAEYEAKNPGKTWGELEVTPTGPTGCANGAKTYNVTVKGPNIRQTYVETRDCKTNKLLSTSSHNILRGLGADTQTTDMEESAVSELKKTYRTTEIALVAALAAAAYLVLK